MVLVTALKDYIEVVHKLVETTPSYINNHDSYNDLITVLTYVLSTLRSNLSEILSFKWISNLWYMPVIVPDIASSLLSEVNLFQGREFWNGGEGGYLNVMNLLDQPVSLSPSSSVSTNILMQILEKFAIGFLNSLFIWLPTSAATFLCFRRFVMQGTEAGYTAALGTLSASIFWLASILLGLRFIVIPWTSLDVFKYFLGFILLIKYFWDNRLPSKEIMKSNRLDFFSIFYFHFLLALTEQSCIYPFISSQSFAPMSTPFESFSAKNFEFYMLLHCVYLLGIFVGSLSLIKILIWLWEEPFFNLYLWFMKTFKKIRISDLVRFVHLFFQTLTVSFAFSSLPYLGIEYAITNPLGFLPQDQTFHQFKQTAFLTHSTSPVFYRSIYNLNNSQKFFRYDDWAEFYSRNIPLDTSLYDQGAYRLFTMEDLHYGADYEWIRRRSEKVKIRGRIKRLRWFPRSWANRFWDLAKTWSRRNVAWRNEILNSYQSSWEHRAAPAWGKLVLNNFRNRNESVWGSDPDWGTRFIFPSAVNLNSFKKSLDTGTESVIGKDKTSEIIIQNPSFWKNQSFWSDWWGRRSLFDNDIWWKWLKNSENSGISTPNLEGNINKTKSSSFLDFSSIKSKIAQKENNNAFWQPKERLVFLNNNSKIAYFHFFSTLRKVVRKWNSRLFFPSVSDPCLCWGKGKYFLYKNKSLPQQLYFNNVGQNYISTNNNKTKASNLSNSFIISLGLQNFLNKNTGHKETNNSSNYRGTGTGKNLNNYLLHPLQFYLHKERAFVRKLQFYGVQSFNNSSLKSSSTPKIDEFSYSPNKLNDGLIKPKGLTETNASAAYGTGPVFSFYLQTYFQNLKPTRLYVKNIKMRRHLGIGAGNRIKQKLYADVKAKRARILSGTPWIRQWINQEGFLIRRKRLESWIRHQHYDNSELWSILMKMDMDNFIKRQPYSHFLTNNEERLLHLRRVVLFSYFDSLRWYNYMEHYRSMKARIGGTKSRINRLYYQQFKGTFHKVRHLFALTPSLSAGSVLSFDQPLINEFSNTSNFSILQSSVIHEELLSNKNSFLNGNKASFDFLPQFANGKDKNFGPSTNTALPFSGFDQTSSFFFKEPRALPSSGYFVTSGEKLNSLLKTGSTFNWTGSNLHLPKTNKNKIESIISNNNNESSAFIFNRRFLVRDYKIASERLWKKWKKTFIKDRSAFSSSSFLSSNLESKKSLSEGLVKLTNKNKSQKNKYNNIRQAFKQSLGVFNNYSNGGPNNQLDRGYKNTFFSIFGQFIKQHRVLFSDLKKDLYNSASNKNLESLEKSFIKKSKSEYFNSASSTLKSQNLLLNLKQQISLQAKNSLLIKTKHLDQNTLLQIKTAFGQKKENKISIRHQKRAFPGRRPKFLYSKSIGTISSNFLKKNKDSRPSLISDSFKNVKDTSLNKRLLKKNKMYKFFTIPNYLESNKVFLQNNKDSAIWETKYGINESNLEYSRDNIQNRLFLINKKAKYASNLLLKLDNTKKVYRTPFRFNNLKNIVKRKLSLRTTKNRRKWSIFNSQKFQSNLNQNILVSYLNKRNSSLFKETSGLTKNTQSTNPGVEESVDLAIKKDNNYNTNNPIFNNLYNNSNNSFLNLTDSFYKKNGYLQSGQAGDSSGLSTTNSLNNLFKKSFLDRTTSAFVGAKASSQALTHSIMKKSILKKKKELLESTKFIKGKNKGFITIQKLDNKNVHLYNLLSKNIYNNSLKSIPFLGQGVSGFPKESASILSSATILKLRESRSRRGLKKAPSLLTQRNRYLLKFSSFKNNIPDKFSLAQNIVLPNKNSSLYSNYFLNASRVADVTKTGAKFDFSLIPSNYYRHKNILNFRIRPKKITRQQAQNQRFRMKKTPRQTRISRIQNLSNNTTGNINNRDYKDFAFMPEKDLFYSQFNKFNKTSFAFMPEQEPKSASSEGAFVPEQTVYLPNPIENSNKPIFNSILNFGNTRDVPFYAGWDDSLRKFVITNRILSRKEAGIKIFDTNTKKSINYQLWPLKGQNSATTFFSHLPFITPPNLEINNKNTDLDTRDALYQRSLLLSSPLTSNQNLKLVNSATIFDKDIKNSNNVQSFMKEPNNKFQITNLIIPDQNNILKLREALFAPLNHRKYKNMQGVFQSRLDGLLTTSSSFKKDFTNNNSKVSIAHKKYQILRTFRKGYKSRYRLPRLRNVKKKYLRLSNNNSNLLSKWRNFLSRRIRKNLYFYNKATAKNSLNLSGIKEQGNQIKNSSVEQTNSLDYGHSQKTQWLLSGQKRSEFKQVKGDKMSRRKTKRDLRQKIYLRPRKRDIKRRSLGVRYKFSQPSSGQSQNIKYNSKNDLLSPLSPTQINSKNEIFLSRFYYKKPLQPYRSLFRPIKLDFPILYNSLPGHSRFLPSIKTSALPGSSVLTVSRASKLLGETANTPAFQREALMHGWAMEKLINNLLLRSVLLKNSKENQTSLTSAADKNQMFQNHVFFFKNKLLNLTSTKINKNRSLQRRSMKLRQLSYTLPMRLYDRWFFYYYIGGKEDPFSFFNISNFLKRNNFPAAKQPSALLPGLGNSKSGDLNSQKLSSDISGDNKRQPSFSNNAQNFDNINSKMLKLSKRTLPLRQFIINTRLPRFKFSTYLNNLKKDAKITRKVSLVPSSVKTVEPLSSSQSFLSENQYTSWWYNWNLFPENSNENKTSNSNTEKIGERLDNSNTQDILSFLKFHRTPFIQDFRSSRSLNRHYPLKGGFVWPGDYLRLQTIKLNK